MSWRLYRPRCIAVYEAQILRRLLEVGADPSAPPSRALLASIDNLLVREEGNGDFHNDSLSFVSSLPRDIGAIIASGVGLMTNDAQVELILWAEGDSITYLELEPFEGARRPIRMPRLESIGPYPDNVCEDDDETNDPTSI